MNKKRILYVILSVLLLSVIFFMLNAFIHQLRKGAYPNEYLPCMYWDGIYYEVYEEIDAEEVKPDKLGEITENLDLTELPEKNGQSNSPIIPVGAEIYSMLDGEDLAMYADGIWWRLQRQ